MPRVFAGELNHKLFIKEIKQRAFQAMILKKFKQLLLVKAKGILCNIFVKKMRMRAAEAFLRGAIKNKPWKEVDHWHNICKAHRRQLADIEKASQLLQPDNPYWQTIAALVTLDNISL
jgi:hypothetical protein